jgi:hypothetical protein
MACTVFEVTLNGEAGCSKGLRAANKGALATRSADLLTVTFSESRCIAGKMRSIRICTTTPFFGDGVKPQVAAVRIWAGTEARVSDSILLLVSKGTYFDQEDKDTEIPPER